MTSIENRERQYEIQIVQSFGQAITKKYRFGDLLVTFPSIQFNIPSLNHMDVLLECDNEFGTQHINGIFVPIHAASKVKNYIFNLPTDKRNILLRNKIVAFDFETEYWYYQRKTKEKRIKEFAKIPNLPNGWEKLLYPRNETTMGWRQQIKDYSNRLARFLSPKNIVSLVVATMDYAGKELHASLILPPTPLIIDLGSLYYSLEVNRVFNTYRHLFDIPKTVYYPLHKRAMDSKKIHRKILTQIEEIKPDIVVIGTIDGDEYIFPQNVYDERKHRFAAFAEELCFLARSSATLVFWYDKGTYCSSYGLKLLKEGFDSFIAPIKGHYNEGGTATDKPSFAYVLDEFPYRSWANYLEQSSEVPCEKDCCKGLRKADLEAMVPYAQWQYKWRHEIGTRNTQMGRFIEKLHQEGRLEDFDVRLKQNKIG